MNSKIIKRYNLNKIEPGEHEVFGLYNSKRDIKNIFKCIAPKETNEEDYDGNTCGGCEFEWERFICQKMECKKEYRKDKKNVIFVVYEEQNESN